MEKKEKKHRLPELILLVTAAAVLIGYACIPQVREIIQKICGLFASGDFTLIREFVESYGAFAASVSFGLMIFQSVAAPLPAFLITFANASLFGWWKGALLSWSSAMAGALVCFYIARLLGRDAAARLTGKAGLEQADRFFEKYGKYTILICRLLPFVSFDLVSYAAGLTSMSVGGFLFATGIGQLPATLVYSWVGSMLTGGAKLMVTGLMLLFAAAAFVMLLKKMYNDREKEIQKKEME